MELKLLTDFTQRAQVLTWLRSPQTHAWHICTYCQGFTQISQTPHTLYTPTEDIEHDCKEFSDLER